MGPSERGFEDRQCLSLLVWIVFRLWAFWCSGAVINLVDSRRLVRI